MKVSIVTVTRSPPLRATCSTEPTVLLRFPETVDSRLARLAEVVPGVDVILMFWGSGEGTTPIQAAPRPTGLALHAGRRPLWVG
jgi:hypothetical protein